MTSYIESSRTKDETISKIFTLSLFVLIRPALWVLLMTIFLLSWNISWGIGGIIFFFLMMPLYYYSIEQGITAKRIIRKRGIIARDVQDILLPAIETISIKQSILGRLLEFGTLIITGRGSSNLVLEYICDPIDVKKHIEETISNESH